MILLGLGAGIVSGAVGGVILYAAASVAYTFWLKQWLLVDLFALAGLYSIRLVAGGEVTGHPVSMWLLAFASFFFFGLAVNKRVSELMSAEARGETTITRRCYIVTDLPILQMMGVGASFAAVSVLALYVQSADILIRYSNPTLLWAIVPIIAFWQCRLWFATARGSMDEDPIVYAAKDWVSYLTVVGLAMILIIAATLF